MFLVSGSGDEYTEPTWRAQVANLNKKSTFEFLFSKPANFQIRVQLVLSKQINQRNKLTTDTVSCMTLKMSNTKVKKLLIRDTAKETSGVFNRNIKAYLDPGRTLRDIFFPY